MIKMGKKNVDKWNWKPVVFALGFVALIVIIMWSFNVIEDYQEEMCDKLYYEVKEVLQVSTGGLLTSSNCLYATNHGNWVDDCYLDIGDTFTRYKC